MPQPGLRPLRSSLFPLHRDSATARSSLIPPRSVFFGTQSPLVPGGSPSDEGNHLSILVRRPLPGGRSGLRCLHPRLLFDGSRHFWGGPTAPDGMRSELSRKWAASAFRRDSFSIRRGDSALASRLTALARARRTRKSCAYPRAPPVPACGRTVPAKKSQFRRVCSKSWHPRCSTKASMRNISVKTPGAAVTTPAAQSTLINTID